MYEEIRKLRSKIIEAEPMIESKNELSLILLLNGEMSTIV